jgi:hypothetical protein
MRSRSPIGTSPKKRLSSQQQRRALLAEPGENLARHTRLRPGLCLTRVDHAAVAEAGFQRRARLAFHDRDLMPELVQIECHGVAHSAGTDHDGPHLAPNSRR